MIQIISAIIKSFRPKPMPLGRWGKIDSSVSLQNRIDWANEDHCGPCGSLILQNKNTNSTNSTNSTNNYKHLTN